MITNDQHDHLIMIMALVSSNSWHLYLSSVNRQSGVLPHEARDYVRASRDRGQENVRFYVPVHNYHCQHGVLSDMYQA